MKAAEGMEDALSELAEHHEDDEKKPPMPPSDGEPSGDAAMVVGKIRDALDELEALL